MDAASRPTLMLLVFIGDAGGDLARYERCWRIEFWIVGVDNHDVKAMNAFDCVLRGLESK